MSPSRATVLNTSATISQHAEIGYDELAKIRSNSLSRTTRQLIANAMAQLDFIRRTADKLNRSSESLNPPA